MSEFLNAISLRQPGVYWIANGTNPLINYDLPAPPWLLDKPIAIHTSKEYDEGADSWIRSRFPELKWPAFDHRVHGKIIAVTKLVAIIAKHERLIEHPRVITVAQALRDRIVTAEDLRWLTDEYGWVCRETMHFAKPIPARGYPRVWSVPRELMGMVTAQFETARRSKAGAA